MTVVTEVVIMTSFSKKHLDTLTTDQLSWQLFATLAMFLSDSPTYSISALLIIPLPPQKDGRNSDWTNIIPTMSNDQAMTSTTGDRHWHK